MCSNDKLNSIISQLYFGLKPLFPQGPVEAILFGSYARGQAETAGAEARQQLSVTSPCGFPLPPGWGLAKNPGLWRMWLNLLLQSNTCSLQSRELHQREPPCMPERRQALDAFEPNRRGFKSQLCCIPAANVRLGNCVTSVDLIFFIAW